MKKNNLPFEQMMKSKPGRKRKTDAGFVPKRERLRLAAKKEPEVVVEKQVNYSEGNFVQLLANIAQNFQAIHTSNPERNGGIYQLMDGINYLSAIAAKKEASSKKYENVELELELLRSQLDEEKKAKEELIQDFRGFAACVQDFIHSSEMVQIQSLPQFIIDCKGMLATFGLPVDKEKDMKLYIDNSGQLVSVPH